MKTIKDYIRTIPDFPKKGIMFRDISTLVSNSEGFNLSIDTMCDMVKDLDFDVIAGAESRGFIFAAPMAYKLHKPFIMVRKKGKLPGKTISQKYDLEYGSTEMEIVVDSIKPGMRVLVVDDLIATGGSTECIIKLVEKLEGIVAGVCVLVELVDLNGREKIKNYRLDSAVTYEGE
jgi:adenine phosphoribosyltransferase